MEILSFTDYLADKEETLEQWLESKLNEMAVPGDYAKTPILFNQDDISYLYQFPPRFWAMALKHRYNDTLLDTKEKHDKGDRHDPQHRIIFPDRKGSQAIFTVQNTSPMLLNRLEKDKDLESLGRLGPDQAHQYQGGHHGYDMGGKYSSGEETLTRGYVPMTITTAHDVLKDWRNAIKSGWLGPAGDGGEHKPVSFGGGRSGPMQLPTASKQELIKAGIPSGQIGPDGKVTWRYLRLKKNGQSPEPVEETSYVPHLLPGKMVDSQAVKHYNELMKQAKEQQDAGQHAQAQMTMQKAEEIKNSAGKHDEFAWNIGRYNDETDPTGKKKKYRALHGNVVTFGGVHPNKNQAERLVSGDEDWEKLHGYVNGRYDAEHDAFFVLNHNSQEVEAEIEKLKMGIAHANSSQEKRNIQERIKDLDRMRWVKYGAMRSGITRFLSSIKGSYEYWIMNNMFDDMVQEALLELKHKTREPAIAKFLKKPSEDSFNSFQRFISTFARNFAARVYQLDWGRGTRRKRRPMGIVSLQQALERGEGGGGTMMDLIDKYVDKLSSVGGEETDPRTRGERQYRTAGGIYHPDLISFGHNLSVLSAQLKAQQDAMEKEKESGSHDTDAVMKADASIRAAIFDELVQLFIATQIKLGREWDMQNAYQFADKNLKKVLAKRGMKVSQAPQELMDQAPKRRKQEKEELAKQDAEKQEILSALGQSSTVSHRGEEAEKEIFDPKTIEFLKSNPEALSRMEKAAQAVQNPEEKQQMLAIVNKVKTELGQSEPMAMAAKKVGDVTPGEAQPRTQDSVNRMIATPAFIQSLVKNPQHLAQATKLAANHPGIAAAVQKAQEILRSQSSL